MNKFSAAQVRILRTLDGATSPVRFHPKSLRSLKALKDAGMVTYTMRVEAQQSYYYGSLKNLYEVTLTRKGGDFIYNGGIDY